MTERRELDELKAKLQRVEKGARNLAHHSLSVLDEGVTAVETGAAAFALGMIEGKFGEVAPLGVPLPLGIALGGHAVAFFGRSILGQKASHLHAFANGALGSYLHTVGRGAGKKLNETQGAAPQGQVPTTQVKGEIGAGARHGDALSDAELARLANKHRRAA